MATRILTIDLEDWFHILGHPETAGPDGWVSYESRLKENVDRLLELLARHKQKATWFCLGWVADKYPEIVRSIAVHHEIACHSDLHRLVFEQSRKQFEEDTLAAKKKIEDLLGMGIDTYRASGFSVTRKSPWFFESLVSCGFKIDCSVFPAARNHGGFPEFGFRSPALVHTGMGDLLELPVNTVRLIGRDVVFSGGGYFRLWPYYMIQKWMNDSDYVMTYFHPRDFDPGQPVIRSLPLHRKFMSYYGLSGSLAKLDRLLGEFKFEDVRSSAVRLSSQSLPKVVLDAGGSVCRMENIA